MKPFIKWAGGKRWLTSHPALNSLQFSGEYFEPFLGSGAVFFHLQPERATISDVNSKLIETYVAVRDCHELVEIALKSFQKLHSKEFYYAERARKRRLPHTRAAQFLYLNRTCWNGLYRENKYGHFNVPIGTKDKIIFEDEDFGKISKALKNAKIFNDDFEKIIDLAKSDDLVFVDPPYTTAHNNNGFIKYNQNIFSWDDQVRLKEAIHRAVLRGATVVLTNADHPNIHELYSDLGGSCSVGRPSVIAGSALFRGRTTEALYVLEG